MSGIDDVPLNNLYKEECDDLIDSIWLPSIPQGGEACIYMPFLLRTKLYNMLCKHIYIYIEKLINLIGMNYT